MGAIIDVNELRKAAQEQGWETGFTRRGHLRWKPPDPTKPIVVGSGTPGDYRALKNFLAQLRRAGFVWPWPPDEASKGHDEDDEGVER